MELCANAAAATANESRNTGFQLRGVIKRNWLFAFVIALCIVLWAPRLNGPIDLRWDASLYYLLGTSLATGQGYRILSEPGAPEAIQYPPLLPGIVALYERALGSTDPAVVGPWLRRSYAALFLVYGMAVLTLARKYLRPLFALAAAVLCLLHHSTIFLSDVLFTELPFALVSIAFVLWAGDAANRQRPWGREVVSFVLATAGFLLRTAGMVLFVGWIFEAIVRRRWQLAIARFFPALLPIVLWQAHIARVHRSDEYHHPAYEYQRASYQFYNVSYADNVSLKDPLRPKLGRLSGSAMARRMAKNFPFVVLAIGETISASDFYWRKAMSDLQNLVFGGQLIPVGLVWAPIVGFAILALVGLILLSRRGAWLITLIVLSSVGLICTTPFRFQFARYLAPIAPLLTTAFVFALSQVEHLFQRRQPAVSFHGKLTRGALAVLLVSTLALQIYTAWQLFEERARDGASFVAGRGAVGPQFFYYGQPWLGWAQAVDWVSRHSTPDAIVATPASHYCYLSIGRRAVSPPLEADAARVRRLLEAVPVSYVIVDNMPPPNVTRRYALPAMESDTINWRLSNTFEGTKLYAHRAGVNQ
jgi:hypothetical protein